MPQVIDTEKHELAEFPRQVGEKKESVDTDAFSDDMAESFRQIQRAWIYFYEYLQATFPTHALYPLWKIENESCRILFNKPLLLELYREDEEYIFYHQGTSVSGAGLTKDEARIDFENTFIEVYSSYKEMRKETLTEKAQQYLSYLESLIRSHENIQHKRV